MPDVREADVSARTGRCKILRQITGASLLDCQRALDECGGDFDRAIEWLRAHMRSGRG